MKRPFLILPLLALAAGCTTIDIHVRDAKGNPVKDALVLRPESWTSGCFLWPTVWSTHVAVLTDNEGIAHLTPGNQNTLSMEAPIVLSPALDRYYPLQQATDDVPPIEDFQIIDFTGGDFEWMRDFDKRRLVFRGTAQKQSASIYARWHRLRFPPVRPLPSSEHPATNAPAASEAHAENAENAEN